MRSASASGSTCSRRRSSACAGWRRRPDRRHAAWDRWPARGGAPPTARSRRAGRWPAVPGRRQCSGRDRKTSSAVRASPASSGQPARGRLALELAGPAIAHRVKRGEPDVGRHRHRPEAAQDVGHDHVLLGFGQTGEGLARPAAFEQQRLGPVETGGRVQANGAAAVPGPQPRGLVGRVVMGPDDLEHQIGATGAARRGHPRRHAPRLERRAERERPPRRRLGHEPGEQVEPAPTSLAPGGRHQVRRQRQRIHARQRGPLPP